MTKLVVVVRDFAKSPKIWFKPRLIKDNKIELNCAQRPSPYRAVNTLRLSYKNQSVNAAQGHNSIGSEIHAKPTNTLRAQ
jgi:hypothetical protein